MSRLCDETKPIMLLFCKVVWIISDVSAVTLQSSVQHVHSLFSQSPAEVQKFPFANL